MKKRFLPLSLLLVMLMLGQTVVIADNGGHYVPRVQGEATAASYMSQLRANQHTGLIDPALMIKAAQSSNAKDGNNELYWINMGPNNIGGQTTAVIYDNQKNAYGNPNGVVYIGSMGGGVYKSYNHGITWHQVGDLNLMVSCMAQDENGVIYFGTGNGGFAASYNGLEDLSYDNSFVGSGLYKLENDILTPIASTTPSMMNDVTDWSFINDIACVDGKLVVATESGLKYSTDKGETWTMAKDVEGNDLAGLAMEVKITADQKVVAAVDGMVYIGLLDSMTCYSEGSAAGTDEDGNIVTLPVAESWLDIACAPSDENVIYVSCIDKNGVHNGVYTTSNQGATWSLALPATASAYGHNLYAGFGLNNHGMVVNPENADVVYVLGYDLWELRKPQDINGYYLAYRRSDGLVSNTSTDYLHVGLHCMAFNPNDNSECFIGTDGGIFKGRIESLFVFSNCNRNYISTRMYSVAYSNTSARVLGAAQDHGTIIIEGDDASNTAALGIGVYPNDYGGFSDSYQPGECAFSMINPNTIFVSYKEGGFERSDKAGQDWISTNFLENLSLSTTAYHFPFTLVENFDDDTNPSEVWFKNETNEAVSHIQAMSANTYPFDVELTTPLAANDSILVHDPISAKLYVAYKDNFYMTRGGLNFNEAPSWYLLANKNASGFNGIPQCMAVTADGDKAYVGFQDGKFFRVENINAINDSTVAITDPAFPIHTLKMELPIDGQCITSISIDPRNEDRLVITLGNYGNENYVLYTENASAEEPTFVAKQGNLPLMPVYSSVIEMVNGYVILGTEHGIYMTENIAASNVNWVAANNAMGDVPVLALKQQRLYHEQQAVVKEYESNGELHTFTTYYPGVYNTGIIYAATYGKGLFRCENFKQHSGENVNEQTATADMNIGMYPNPAATDAKICFDVKGSANVSYVVYDITGRVVMSQNLGNFSEGSHEASVNVSNLRSGSYILRICQGANSSCVKFMVY